MAKLPENYIEILSYLRDVYPDGMTTPQIMTEAKKRRYFGLKNTTQISGALYYMRGKKTIESLDTFGAKLHKITGYGLSQLENEIGPATARTINLQTDPIDQIIQDIQSAPTETNASDLTAPGLADSSPQQVRDLLTEFDEHMHIVRTALIAELAEIKTPRIENKHLKLAILKKLEPMYNSEISSVLLEIYDDLEQMVDSHE